MTQPHRIVVVGGGAGGLELATHLGNHLGRRGKAEITLIDASWTHTWKPLLHEVAAGTLDMGEHQLEYLAQARNHHFRFRLGAMEAIDRERRLIYLAPNIDEEGVEFTPRRSFPYDTLIIAVGSVTNDFGIKGVGAHCLNLDTTHDAHRFQQHLLRRLLHVHAREAPIEPGELNIAVVGGGATGVELVAQLHLVTRELSAYGLDRIDPDAHIDFDLIEASERLLPALPPRLSAAITERLRGMGVKVHTGERVVEVTEDAIHTGSGRIIPAVIKVWAAGIKAPDFLADLQGLETTSSNQLLVRRTLETTADDNIFAMGDCAACPLDDESGFIPPRAQAAHQQAKFLAKQLQRRLRGEPMREFRYRDYGSLVTLGKYSTVGSLMGNITGSVMISGFIARMVYLSLHQMHQLALHGWTRTIIINIANLLRRGINPQIKLH